MNSLDSQGDWVIARRKGNRVRYRNTVTAAMTPWEKLPFSSAYYNSRDRLLALLR